MTVHHLFPAALAFVLGAAFLADGEPDGDLRERLRQLRDEADRVDALEREARAARNMPPMARNGMTFDHVPLDDLIQPVYDAGAPTNAGEDGATRFDRLKEEGVRAFGGSDEIGEIARAFAGREGWSEGSHVASAGRGLLLFHRPKAIAAVRRFIDTELRPRARRTVSIETRVIEVPAARGPALAARIGTAVEDDALARELEAAPPVFSGRVRALCRQRALLWHGGQHAYLADAEVEVAQEASTSGPIVDVAILGGVMTARAIAPSGSKRIRLELAVEHREDVQPVRSRESKAAGPFQLQAIDATALAAEIDVPQGRWAVAGEGRAGDGLRRFVLVRASLVNTEGTKR